jgi:hypothetical protein
MPFPLAGGAGLQIPPYEQAFRPCVRAAVPENRQPSTGAGARSTEHGARSAERAPMTPSPYAPRGWDGMAIKIEAQTDLLQSQSVYWR